jgi:hypothetical protein
MKILVKFHHQPTIEIAVDDTETGRLYFDLSQRQNAQQQPFYRDTLEYTQEYLVKLAHQARDAFGWDWVRDKYDISVTAQLHKDLEHSVGQLGFENIPAQYDQLLYDLHHCLHAVQFGKTQPGRRDNFQIEWLTDQSVALPKSFEFKETSRDGDLILINPYVGHNPLQIYMENDFTSLATTCRFHDIIKPGIVITSKYSVTKDTILYEFVAQAPDFVELHGQNKIRYYAGAAVIGHVVNLDQFMQLRQHNNTLILKCVEFYE